MLFCENARWQNTVLPFRVVKPEAAQYFLLRYLKSSPVLSFRRKNWPSAVRTAQFALDLGEIIDQSINMRVSACPFFDTPHANPHLEALDQYKSSKAKTNPVVSVRACHIPRIKHTRTVIQKIHHQWTIKSNFSNKKSTTLGIISHDKDSSNLKLKVPITSLGLTIDIKEIGN